MILTYMLYSGRKQFRISHGGVDILGQRIIDVEMLIEPLQNET